MFLNVSVFLWIQFQRDLTAASDFLDWSPAQWLMFCKQTWNKDYQDYQNPLWVQDQPSASDVMIWKDPFLLILRCLIPKHLHHQEQNSGSWMCILTLICGCINGEILTSGPTGWWKKCKNYSDSSTPLHTVANVWLLALYVNIFPQNVSELSSLSMVASSGNIAKHQYHWQKSQTKRNFTFNFATYFVPIHAFPCKRKSRASWSWRSTLAVQQLRRWWGNLEMKDQELFNV